MKRLLLPLSRRIRLYLDSESKLCNIQVDPGFAGMQDTRVRECGFQKAPEKPPCWAMCSRFCFPYVTSKQAVHEAVNVKPKS